MMPPVDTVRSVWTSWLGDELRKAPYFQCDSWCPIGAKCLAVVMFMYGARPAESVAIDIIKKAAPRMLDVVTGVVGDNTMILAKDVNGLRIPFILPAAGFLPHTFPMIMSRLCGNSDRGVCSLCDSKRRGMFIFGKRYSCECFVHDYCALEGYHSDAALAREKTWSFTCGCNKTTVYTSPSKLFNPIRLTVMTGDNVTALKKTVDKYKNNGERICSNVDGALLQKGIGSMLNNVGLKKHSIRVPVLNDEANFSMHMPDQSKAGAFFQKTIHNFMMNGEVRANKQSPTKTEINVIAGIYLKSYIAALQDEFSEYIEGGGPVSGMKLQEFTWKRLFVYKVNTKVEAIYAEEVDGEKLRCFFPAHVCKFMLDTMIFKPLVNSLYGKGSVMLGHKWVYGGAQKLYNRLKCFKKLLAWDIKGLDSSMKARLIELIFGSLFHAYDPSSVTGDVYRLFRTLYLITVGHYVSKVVAWIDDFRILVGAMASGELMTSIFNTLYCIVAVLCWIHHVADILFGTSMSSAEKKAFIDEHISKIVLYIFGDDGLFGTNSPHLNLFEDTVLPDGRVVPSLDSYLEEQWFLSVKKEESNQSSTLLSVPNEVGDVPHGSITILKRAFIEDEVDGIKCVAPFKSTSISIGKLVKNEVPFRKKDDKAYVNYLNMCRAIGHAVDTCGSNPVMYDVCKYIYDVSFSEFVLA